ncbi:MAG: cell division protein CrgA [Actinomycetota bacterium]|nr:cell division protein CrgA [Actinomycetota bacterium]
MPKSKSKRKQFQQQPPPKPKPKTSPPWVAWLFFALMGIGVGLILAYYVAFEGSGPWLFVGLGLITASFVVATQWH